MQVLILVVMRPLYSKDLYDILLKRRNYIVNTNEVKYDLKVIRAPLRVNLYFKL